MEPLRNVSIEVESRCNLSCSGCYFLKQKQSKAMTTEEIKNVLDIIRDNPKNDNFRLAFIGGEPFLNKHLLNLVKYASKNVAKPEILTNGTLATKNKLEKLKNYVQEIQVSLDAPVPELHDFMRGVKGTWNKAIDCLQWCILLKIPRTIAFTIKKSNFGYLQDMLHLSESLTADLKVLRFIPYSKEDRTNALTPMQNEYLARFTHHNKLTSSMPTISLINLQDQRCDAGINRIAIKADGSVSPCDFIPKTFGNIKKDSLPKIMRTMFRWREHNLELSKRACKGCKNFGKCFGGCLAMQTVFNEGKDRGCWM